MYRLVPTLLIALLLTACNTTYVLEPNISNGDYAVKVEVVPSTPKKGDTVTVTFHINYQGRPLVTMTDLKVLHATIGSSDLHDVAHYFNEIKYQTPGVYQLSHTLTSAGPYTLWLDIPDITTRDHHQEHVDFQGTMTFDVTGDALDRIALNSKDQYQDISSTLVLRNNNAEITYTKDQRPYPLIEQVDHYYMLFSPENDIYVLDHVDVDNSSNNRLYTKDLPLNLPGLYTLWVMAYSRESSTYLDLPSRFVFRR